MFDESAILSVTRGHRDVWGCLGCEVLEQHHEQAAASRLGHLRRQCSVTVTTRTCLISATRSCGQFQNVAKRRASSNGTEFLSTLCSVLRRKVSVCFSPAMCAKTALSGSFPSYCWLFLSRYWTSLQCVFPVIAEHARLAVFTLLLEYQLSLRGFSHWLCCSVACSSSGSSCVVQPLSCTQGFP